MKELSLNMKKTKYDLGRVPRELLEKYIEHHTTVIDPDYFCQTSTGQAIRKAAEVSLRTRAEVNADVISYVRTYAAEHGWATTEVRGLYGVGAERLAFALKSILDEKTSD